MRIAFVTTEYVTEPSYDGGLSNYVHRVVLSLKKFGHYPIVIVISDRDEVFFHGDIEVHRVRYSLEGWQVRLNNLTRKIFDQSILLLRTSWLLNSRLKMINLENPISLVQFTHLGGVAFFKPKGIPAVIRLSSFTSLWRKFGAFSNMPPFQIQQLELIEKWALKKVDFVFGPCKQIAAIVSDELKKPVRTIESPFLMDVKGPDESIYRKHLFGKKYFLFFGTLIEHKGVSIIAETLPFLLKNNPSIYFAFVGKQAPYKGSPMMNYVMEKAGEYGNRVLNLGKMPHEQLYPILGNAYAVVLPSLVENFANVCLEAMAHRRVVIGTKRTSFEDTIIHGKNGFLSEPGDPVSLLETMEMVLNLPEEERKRIGEMAQKQVLNYQPEKVVRKLLEFYKEILEPEFRQ
jgi:glycogen(starch) synthase